MPESGDQSVKVMVNRICFYSNTLFLLCVSCIADMCKTVLYSRFFVNENIEQICLLHFHFLLFLYIFF